MTRALAAGSIILSPIRQILSCSGRATVSAAQGKILRKRRATIIAGIAFLCVSYSARAQDQPATCADWFAVQSWSGTITYSGSGSSSDQFGTSETISESAKIDFTTAKGNQPCDVNQDFSVFGLAGAGWSTQGLQSITYSVTLHDTFSSPQDDASFGKKTGQPGFDPLADVNGDGIVNILDLSTVARLLPAGKTCP